MFNVRVYVANLRAYSEGELLGTNVVLPMDEDELRKEIQAIMRPGSDDEEYAIHDYEAPFSLTSVSVETDIFGLNRQLDALQYSDVDEDELEALIEIMPDLDEAIEALRNENVIFHHHVEAENTRRVGWKELGEYMIYEYGYMNVPEHLPPYIDFEHVGRDLECSGHFHIAGNGIVVELLRL